MASLHEGASMSFYAGSCGRIRTMWGAWQQAQRQQAFAMTHRSLCQRVGLPVPPITFRPSDDLGSFSWGAWTVEVGNRPFRRSLTKEQFVDLCSTVYHETRHAEQFYRVAQGLLLGRLDFPERLGAGGSLAGRIAAGMGMKSRIVRHAEMHKDGYLAFARSPKMSHCTTGSGPGWSNWDPTVSDWLERTYAKSKATFARKGQDADSGTAIDRAWYRGAEDERDAYAVEGALKRYLNSSIT